MLISDYLDRLLKALDEQRRTVVTRISGCGITTFEDYRFCVGKLQAINETEERAKKLYVQMMDSGPVKRKYEEVINEKTLY